MSVFRMLSEPPFSQQQGGEKQFTQRDDHVNRVPRCRKLSRSGYGSGGSTLNVAQR
jgi:hypothetical protein